MVTSSSPDSDDSDSLSDPVVKKRDMAPARREGAAERAAGPAGEPRRHRPLGRKGPGPPPGDPPRPGAARDPARGRPPRTRPETNEPTESAASLTLSPKPKPREGRDGVLRHFREGGAPFPATPEDYDSQRSLRHPRAEMTLDLGYAAEEREIAQPPRCFDVESGNPGLWASPSSWSTFSSVFRDCSLLYSVVRD